MKTVSYWNDMRVLGGINHDSSKAVLNTVEPAKVKSRETSKQGIIVVNFQQRHLQPKEQLHM